MEVVVEQKTGKRMIFEIKGATHTVCGALKDALWNDKAITAAAYNLEHPFISHPKFVIETNGSKTPEQCVMDAITQLQKNNKEFLGLFAKKP